MHIGFIGVGRMGGGLAANLLKHGFPLTVFDLNPDAVKTLTAQGAASASDPRDLARQVDLVFTSLPLPQDVESVLLGPPGCVADLPPGGGVIDVSTVGPSTAQQLQTHIESQGRHFLACPLGMGPTQAAEASEPMYVGGPRETFEQYRPILEAIGKPVYLGDVQQATGFKLISNLVGLTNMAVLAEGVVLLERLGIEPDKIPSMLETTGADSRQLRTRLPWVLAGDFTPRFSVDLTAKDLKLAITMAGQWGMTTPMAQMAYQAFRTAQLMGFGSEDQGAVIKGMR